MLFIAFEFDGMMKLLSAPPPKKSKMLSAKMHSCGAGLKSLIQAPIKPVMWLPRIMSWFALTNMGNARSL